MAKKPVQFVLNGEAKAAFADDGQNLLEFLRREVGDLTPKFGCGQGTCGACTVLVDGEPHLSCLMLAEVAEGQRIETTAGLGVGANLHPLQEAFMEHFAAQCGFCTPGMLMAALERTESRSGRRGSPKPAPVRSSSRPMCRLICSALSLLSSSQARIAARQRKSSVVRMKPWGTGRPSCWASRPE